MEAVHIRYILQLHAQLGFARCDRKTGKAEQLIHYYNLKVCPQIS